MYIHICSLDSKRQQVCTFIYIYLNVDVHTYFLYEFERIPLMSRSLVHFGVEL